MAYTFKHGDRPLDGYSIQRAVGRGGFGEVYYAISDGGREVALKYLRENPQIELRGVAHCINLKSPHLVSIFDVKKNDEGDYFVIMEYASGPSLRDLLIAEPNGLGPQKAAYLVREIAKGLGYLHDRGIVHRDLKPGNIFFDEGYVKIGDYGLSKFISVSRHSAQTASVGTVHYMAPEVGSGNYHRGIDIYALGVMLYEMLLGRVPFEGSSMGEVLMKHLTEQPEVTNLPQPFGKIINKALQKDPKDRYQNVYDMIDDLMEVDDVRTSLAGFNPVSLGGSVGRIAPTDDSPVPSPNPAPHQQPIPPPRRPGRPFNLDAGNLPPEMARKIHKTSSKVAKRMRKLDSKHGTQRPTVAKSQPINASDAPTTKREFLQRALLALAMAVCLGFGLAMVADLREEGYVSAILMIAGMAGGLAIGCRAFAHASRNRVQPRWIERFFMAVPAGILLGIGSIPLLNVFRNDDPVLAMLGALVGVAMFSNWRKRIKTGSGGKLSIGNAFSAGLFAFILTAIFSRDGDLSFISAGIAAAASLVFEALAWLFPLQDWISGRIPAAQTIRDEPALDWARPLEDRASQETIAMPGGGEAYDTEKFQDRFLEPASTFAIDHRSHRWTLTRVLGALLGFACLVGLVAATVYLFAGKPSGEEIITNDGGRLIHEFPRRALRPNEFIPVAVAGAGCLGMMLFAFRKVGRYRTGGFYRDTGRPILMTAVLMGLALGASTIVSGGRSPGLVVSWQTVLVLIVSMILFVFLTFVRGRKWPNSQSDDAETNNAETNDHHESSDPTTGQPFEHIR